MSFYRSIRWRFQIWYGLLLVLVLAGFALTAYQLERSQRLRQLDSELQRRVAAVTSALRGGGPPPPPPPFGGPPPMPPRREVRMTPVEEALFQGNGAESYYYVVWLRNGEPVTKSRNAPADVPRPQIGGAPQRDRGEYREFFAFPAPLDCVLVGCSTRAQVAELQREASRLAAAGGAVLAFGLLGGWWLATHALRPIGAIATAAARIAEGNLSERIPPTSVGSELGQLAEVLNSTFARLDAVFAQQAQFTSDAAHELRTPVTVLLTETQATLARERSPEEYRQALEICQRTAQRMRRLIESLLELARLDSGEAEISSAPCDLSSLCRECIELLQPLARSCQVTVSSTFASTLVRGDADRLTQVVMNLLTNAIEHNVAGGQVQITTSAEGSEVILTVTDDGPGIEPVHLPHIFERFYRGDASRSRRTGSTGLGLAIASAIVEAHGGSIVASSEVDKGTTVTVRLARAESVSILMETAVTAE